jgi:uncharacterized protein (TIGR01244 family)
MKTSSTIGVLALLSALVSLAAPAAEIPSSARPGEIPNYLRIRPDVATSGQPSAEALKKLKEMGFTTVVNLRTPKEGIAGDRAAVEAQGLRFVSVPVAPGTFGAKDVESVAKVLDDSKARPALVYCHSGNRVGAFWAVYQVRKGKSVEEALAEGRRIGLKSPQMLEAVQRVLKQKP